MSDDKLKGMRELSKEEIRAMNEIADLGNQIGNLIDRMELFDSGLEEIDRRWIAIGKTHLQTGIMCVKRAIGRPENF